MKFFTESEITTYFGQYDEQIEFIVSSAENWIDNEIGPLIPQKTVTIQGPKDKLTLEPYIVAIEKVMVNNTQIEVYDANLTTGEIDIQLESDDVANVTYYPSLEFTETLYPTCNYIMPSVYPVWYVISSNVNVTILRRMILRIDEPDEITVTYRAGLPINNEIKMAILLLSKYWYKNFSESLQGVTSYKIGDISVSFDKKSAIPIEINLVLEKYRKIHITDYGDIQ